MAWEVTIPGVPPAGTSQLKGLHVVNGQPRFFKKQATKRSEQYFHAHFLRERPPEPFCGPLSVVCELVWPFTTAIPKRDRVAGWRWKTTRPDIDNYLKILQDALTTARVIEDDALIVRLAVEKKNAIAPCVKVTIERLEQP